MASIYLKSNTIFTLFLSIFSAISISAIGELVDTDGDILINGGSYYIIPQSIGVGGGLVPTSGSDSPCPYSYITRSKDETDPGSPVTISSPSKLPFIALGSPVTVSFDTYSDICSQPLKAWEVVSYGTRGDKSFVAAGVADSNPIFAIEDDRGVNKIKYISNNGEKKEVGFFMYDGYLGIDTEFRMPVVFKKASKVLVRKV